MSKNFSLKSLKKIAKEEIRMEKLKEIKIAKSIIEEFEDRIIDDINNIIINGLKYNKDVFEINPSKMDCLSGRRDLTNDIRIFLMCHFLRLYKEKGFHVEKDVFRNDTFFVFPSRYSKWKHKLYYML